MRTILFTLLATFATLATAQRQALFDDGWQFALAADTTSHLVTPFRAGTEPRPYGERGTGGEAVWRPVSLPHDWSIEPEAAHMADANAVGPFSHTAIGGDATGFTVGGEGWYRKTFITPADGNLHTLYFEGAYNQADVWVNGQHAAFNAYGYSSFRVELDDLLNPAGEENEVMVRVRNLGKNSRWYAGSGIYRHVWLLSTPALHLDPWTTYVQGQQADGTITLLTTLHNETAKAAKAQLSVCILSPDGQQVASAKAKATIAAGTDSEQTLTLHVDNPQLWSPDSPSLYTAIISLKGAGDEITIPFGLRSVSVDAEHGFLLNGQSILLKGGCVHHDNGLLGAAAIDAAETRKLRLLKENGYNAVRCSHNPPSEHFLHVCDSIGLLVIDEAFDQWLAKKTDNDYHQYFPTWSERDLTTLIRRDRNHPSVIMWSIGNEIPGRIELDGLAAADRLSKTAKSLDPERPVTAALCSWDDKSYSWETHSEKGFVSLDVGGYNYLYDKYEADHERYPQRVMMGTESYPKQVAENWLQVERHPYVIGDFVWTAMDYVGEAGIGSASFREKGGQSFFQKWPWMNGWCGDIDLIGQKKPQSYVRDVVWGLRPIAMAVEEPCPQGQHMAVSAWGWPLEHQWWTGNEGDTLNVNVYSRAARVRLYLNDVLIGEEATSPTFKATFRVPYQPGTLRAEEGANTVGALLAVVPPTDTPNSFSLTTPGEPVALRLTADTATPLDTPSPRERGTGGEAAIHADGRDLAYITIELVDAQGRVCFDSERQLRISLSGSGRLLAAGNASPTDMESFRSPTPRLFEGRALAIAQAPSSPGTFTLTVETDGLPAQAITIHCE